MRVHTRLLAAAAAGVIALSMSGCSVLDSLLGSSAPARDEDGNIIEAQDNADVFALKVGDCLDSSDLDGGGISSVPVKPCAEPHEDEVYYSYQMTDATFPGEDAVSNKADEVCRAQFEGFVGMRYTDSTLNFWTLLPSKETWDSGDREILCLIYDQNNKLVTGSLAGAAR